MLLKMEKKDSSTQTKSNIGPCRVHPCRGYTRIANNFLQRDRDKNRQHWFDQKANRVSTFSNSIFDIHKLCRAANLNNVEALEQLLKNGVNPNCWDNRKRTPLHLAASKGYAEAVG